MENSQYIELLFYEKNLNLSMEKFGNIIGVTKSSSKQYRKRS